MYWALAERIAPIRGSELSFALATVEAHYPAADWIGRNAYRGLYERAEVRVITGILPAGGVAVDVGANLGYLTLVMAIAVGPTGKVVAFEPSPASAKWLVENVRRNGLSYVTVRHVAVGRQRGSGELTTPPAADLNSGLAALRHVRPEAQGDVTAVEIVTLDEELLPLDTGSIDLVKVDVEGGEADVLQGARRLLDSGRVRHMLVEVSPEFGSVQWAADLIERFRDKYTAHTITERGVLRRRPRLIPISAAEAASLDRQVNLLLSLRVEAES